MAYEKAAVRYARWAEGRERREQQDRAQVAEVIAEFDGHPIGDLGNLGVVIARMVRGAGAANR
jgi:hypothetical protein